MAVAAGLLVANMLGVAAAEAPTATPVRTVSVQGVANVPIAQGASLAVATSAYRQGMANAVADGLSKAEFLAGKAGATLGSVQNIAEGGGYIYCTGGDESSYVEYEGERPDFGSSNVGVAVAPQAAAATPEVRKPLKRRSKRVSAKAASAVSCTLSTQVSLVYAID